MIRQQHRTYRFRREADPSQEYSRYTAKRSRGHWSQRRLPEFGLAALFRNRQSSLGRVLRSLVYSILDAIKEKK